MRELEVGLTYFLVLGHITAPLYTNLQDTKYILEESPNATVVV